MLETTLKLLISASEFRERAIIAKALVLGTPFSRVSLKIQIPKQGKARAKNYDAAYG